MSDFKNNTSNISDKELWDKITKKDKKYSKTNRVIFKKSKLDKIEKNINEKNKLKKFVEAPAIKEEIIINKLLEEKYLDPKEIPAGISLNQAENLKKGKIRPEVEIDLHGFTQEKANSYLKDKLTEFHKKNIRCVLVITGKKIGKNGAEGVLRREVPKWLNISPLRQMIIMTSWAQNKDGGDGALYVLLKKRR
mgnify:CR=1 FL=1|tara:strand:+ start:839 stop:1417 length:579 start_codon:yes stop_codon:yes gene_type:complete